MGTYKARENNKNIQDYQENYDENKQRSTEKAVNLAGEVALDYFTAGKGSRIKNMAEKVPVLGGAVKNTWDGAVKNISRGVSNTPVGDVLKAADDAGITDAAETAKDIITNGSNNATFKNKFSGNIKNKTNDNKSNFKFLDFGSFKMSPSLKIKIVVIAIFVFLFFVMVVAVFANDDIDNLELTNSSTMTPKSNDGTLFTKQEIESRLVYVGNSRIVGMVSALENNINYIAEVGKGYDWYKNVALASIEEKIQNNPNTIIVLSLGVNDLNNIDNYILAYKELIAKYPSNSFYIMSVNPVDESKARASGYSITNSDIEAFNKKLVENFSSNYIDIYNNLTNIGTNDGLHYDANTYKTIHNLIISSISGSLTEKNGNAGKNVTGKLE